MLVRIWPRAHLLAPIGYRAIEAATILTRGDRQQPVVVHVVEEAFDVGFDDVAIAAVLQIEGEVADGIARSSSRPVAVAAAEEVGLVDRCQQFAGGELDQFVFQCRDAQWPLLAILLGDVDAPHQFRAVPLGHKTLGQCLDASVQILGILARRHVIDATGGLLVEVAPAVPQQVGIDVPIEVLKPVLRVALRLDGYRPQ